MFPLPVWIIYYAMRRIRKPRRAKLRIVWWRNKLLWRGLFVVLIFGIIFYGIFFHPAVQLNEIRVEGMEGMRARNLKDSIRHFSERSFGFVKTQSIFLLQLGKIQENILQNFPQLSSVNIKRVFPDAIEVSIEERKEVAVWCFREEPCFSVDAGGIIFQERSKEQTKGLPFLIRDMVRQEVPPLGEQVISKDLFTQMAMLKTELNTMQIDPTEIILVSPGRMNIRIAEGWEIYFALPVDIPWQITRLKVVLEKELPAEKRKGLEYIDMRFSKVYYKVTPAKENENHASK